MLPSLFAISPDVTAPIPIWLDLLSVMVGSLSGILVAREKELDLVGFIALSLMCGLGGGLLRDMIMQRGGVYVLTSPLAIPLSTATGILGFLFSGALLKFPSLWEWVDIFSVALFVAAGTGKAMNYQLSLWSCLLMGTFTGVGGGMLRDISLGDTPRIFQRSNLYALCAVVGSAAYYLLIYIGINRFWVVVGCVSVVVTLRRLSLRYDIMSPNNVDLTPKVGHAAKKAYVETKYHARNVARHLRKK